MNERQENDVDDKHVRNFKQLFTNGPKINTLDESQKIQIPEGSEGHDEKKLGQREKFGWLKDAPIRVSTITMKRLMVKAFSYMN